MKFEQAIKEISKQDIEYLYLIEQLSKKECSLKLNISNQLFNHLLDYYEIKRDSNLVRAKKTSNTKKKNKPSIDLELLKKMYLVQNKSCREIKTFFNLTGWALDKILKENGLKKGRKQSSSLVLESKYKKAGSKENYNKQLLEKRVKTINERYGSKDNFRVNVSSKCLSTWLSKPLEERKAHAALSMSHGEGWNHNTSTKTLMEKYGVNNAYALSSYTNQSKVNKEFGDSLTSNNIGYQDEFIIRTESSYYRYDFKVGNNLIEINPWPFHNITWSPTNKTIDKNYHYNKSLLAKENDFRCIHIFDWDDKDKIINLLKPREKVFARNCTIREVYTQEAYSYINNYHLQGYAKCSIKIGLFLSNELVSIMTFGKPRYNKNYQYELIRYCSHKYVVGGAEKLFNYFLEKYNPTSIISYCDNSKFKGGVYINLKFTLKNKGLPSQHWYNPQTKVHITNNLLLQQGFDRLFKTNYGKGVSNEELMLQNGFVEIYDCGQDVYEWKLN